MDKHKFDILEMTPADVKISCTPQGGIPVEAGYLVQDTAGGEFKKADGSKPIFGIVIGLEGTTNVVGVNQTIACQGMLISCWVDGDYSVGDKAYCTAEGKATKDATNVDSEFGIFTLSGKTISGGKIGFVRKL